MRLEHSTFVYLPNACMKFITTYPICLRSSQEKGAMIVGNCELAKANVEGSRHSRVLLIVDEDWIWGCLCLCLCLYLCPRATAFHIDVDKGRP